MRIMLVAFLSLMLVSCGGDSSAPAEPPPISISLSASALTALQDGTPASVTITVQRPAGNTNPVTVSVTPVAGMTAQIAQPAAGTTGQVTFAVAGASAGPHSVTIQATDGPTNATASLVVDVAVVATVKAVTNTAAGFNGMLRNFMATSFQPAEWDNQFFVNNAPPRSRSRRRVRLAR